MSDWTLGEIAANLALLAGIITASGVIYHFVVKNVQKTLENAFKQHTESTCDRLGKIERKLDDIDLSACKNFMVQFLAQVERGQVDDEETIRFWEVYDKYTQLGGNSYIHEKVDRMKKENKL